MDGFSLTRLLGKLLIIGAASLYACGAMQGSVAPFG